MSDARSKVFHVADLLAGLARLNPCPNCGTRFGERVVRKHFGLASIYRCRRCDLLFRPTGLQTGRVARWYYSRLYEAGVATEMRTTSRAEAVAWAIGAGKDRSAIGRALLPLLAPEDRRIGVIGANWGYELLCFEPLGVPLYGIEPGDPRREHGRRAFGLALFPSVEDAARAGHGGGILFSSHVLEHIPELDATLDRIDAHLRPSLHVHLTPRVDPFGEDVVPVIGREHPVGITEAFWRRRAARRGMILAMAEHRASPREPYCETLTIMGHADRLPGLPAGGLDAIRVPGHRT